MRTYRPGVQVRDDHQAAFTRRGDGCAHAFEAVRVAPAEGVDDDRHAAALGADDGRAGEPATASCSKAPTRADRLGGASPSSGPRTTLRFWPMSTDNERLNTMRPSHSRNA